MTNMTFRNSLKSIVKKQLPEERSGIVKSSLLDKPEELAWEEMHRTEPGIFFQNITKCGLLKRFDLGCPCLTSSAKSTSACGVLPPKPSGCEGRVSKNDKITVSFPHIV